MERGARFAGAHLINYLLQMILLNSFIYLGLANQLAPILVFIISVPTNFVLVRVLLKKIIKGSVIKPKVNIFF